MQLTAKGFERLSRVGVELEKARKRVTPRAEASALNKAAAVARKSARKVSVAQTGLPASAVNRRFWMKRADARKPRRSARVSGGRDKFSASYKHPKTGKALARKVGGGVKIGKKRISGAFIGKSKRYDREFVGRRTGPERDSMMFPSFNVGSTIRRALKRQEPRAMKVAEREYKRQFDARYDKEVRRIMGRAVR